MDMDMVSRTNRTTSRIQCPLLTNSTKPVEATCPMVAVVVTVGDQCTTYHRGSHPLTTGVPIRVKDFTELEHSPLIRFVQLNK